MENRIESLLRSSDISDMNRDVSEMKFFSNNLEMKVIKSHVGHFGYCKFLHLTLKGCFFLICNSVTLLWRGILVPAHMYVGLHFVWFLNVLLQKE